MFVTWFFVFFFFNDTATTEIYTLSLHDALPIYAYRRPRRECEVARGEVGLGVRELGVVAGWVDLYGHVIEHADGYRAESALVTLLVVKDRALFPYVPVLERRYEVDAMMGVGPEAILP